ADEQLAGMKGEPAADGAALLAPRREIDPPQSLAGRGLEGADAGMGIHGEDAAFGNHRLGEDLLLVAGPGADIGTPGLAQAVAQGEVMHGMAGIAAGLRPVGIM